MKRHVLLIGLPGSGKTTVGRLAAHALGCPFVDIDAEVERRAGMPIVEIFDRRGEAAFREWESGEVERAVERDPGVVAPGGGWAAHRDNLERALRSTFAIFLETDPVTAVERTAAEANRPLLLDEPLERMKELLRIREPFYRRCHGTVGTAGRTAAEVAGDVVRLARSQAGW